MFEPMPPDMPRHCQLDGPFLPRLTGDRAAALAKLLGLPSSSGSKRTYFQTAYMTTCTLRRSVDNSTDGKAVFLFPRSLLTGSVRTITVHHPATFSLQKYGWFSGSCATWQEMLPVSGGTAVSLEPLFAAGTDAGAKPENGVSFDERSKLALVANAADVCVDLIEVTVSVTRVGMAQWAGGSLCLGWKHM